MDDVNERLPADARIPEIGLSLLRGRVIKLHRHYLPASGMRKELYFWWALEMVALLSALAMGVRFV